jgi:hypothetical protein
MKKEKGFFYCDKGNKSSNRLVGIPSSFLTLILSAIVVIVCLFWTVTNQPLIKFTLLFLGIFSLITLGLTKVDKILELFKSVRGIKNE